MVRSINLTIPRQLVLCGILIILFSITAGCTEQRVSDRDLVMIDSEEAIKAVRGHRRLAGLGERRPGAWIDARSEREFREGHIPGAIHMPLERARDDHRILREYSPLIVYGNDYNSPRANAVSKILIRNGHRNVKTLRGGLRAWKADGHDLATEEGNTHEP